MLNLTFVILRIVVWSVALLLTATATSTNQNKQVVSPAPSRPSPTPGLTINRPTSDPYKGSLSIFEDPKRAERLQIDRVMDLLAIRAGSVVADVGAGSGWFTVRAARRVGPQGVVYAVDINDEYLKHINSRAEGESLPNIRTTLGKEDDPLLPADAVDSILILKTYHEFSKPLQMLQAMHKALHRDGVLGIIDRNGAGDDHGIDSEAVIKEATRAGFKLVANHDFVKPDNMDYFLIFRKTTSR